MTVKDPVKAPHINGNSKPAPGTRLMVPQLIDEIAQTDPNRPWVSLPYDDDDLSKGYEDISFARLAAAANRLSWLVKDTIGASSSSEAIAYYGPSDIRYSFVQVAAAKTGHKVLFCSALNSDDVNVSLLEQTKCKAILSASVTDVSQLVTRSGAQHVVIPELDDILNNSEGTKPYPFTKTYEEAKFDPYMILHTSGTTGMPKPCEFNHAGDAAHDVHNLQETYEGRTRSFHTTFDKPGYRYLIPSPQPHAGMSVQILRMTLFQGAVIVPGLRNRVPRPEELVNIIKYSNVQVACLYPFAMNYIASHGGGEDIMKSFHRVYVAGASLGENAARVWSKYTTVQNFWGCTENVIVPHLQTEKDEWDYCVIDMDRAGLDFRPVETHSYDQEGNRQPLYQLFVTLTPKSDGYTPWHSNKGITLDSSSAPYPELDTKDLFTPHRDPKKAHYMWKFVGRADDMMSLTTGNNIYRTDIENWVAEHHAVHAALVVGTGHRQTLLVVELAEDVPNENATAVNIWEEAVDPMNKKLPLQGCIAKSHVLLAPHGSFERTPKGSVARRQTEGKFREETEEWYNTHGDAPPTVR